MARAVELCPLEAKPNRSWVPAHPSSLTCRHYMADWTSFLVQASKFRGRHWRWNDIDIVDPDSNAEIRSKLTPLTTQVTEDKLGSKKFEHFSNWSSLTKAVARLCHIAQCFSLPSGKHGCVGWHMSKNGLSVADITKAEHVIIKCVEHESYSKELKCIKVKPRPSQNQPSS